jgi:hypothetical protein
MSVLRSEVCTGDPLLVAYARPLDGTLDCRNDVLDIRSALLKQNVCFGDTGDLLEPHRDTFLTSSERRVTVGSSFRRLLRLAYQPVHDFFFFFSFSGWGESIWYVGDCWPIVPARIIGDECGAVGGMRIGRGNRSTRRKPASVPLCPPQIPHDLGSNTGRRDGKPTTNRLSYGTRARLLLMIRYMWRKAYYFKRQEVLGRTNRLISLIRHGQH